MNRFESLELLSKCFMANYCRHSSEDKYCIADDEVVEKCPYLRVISEITILSMDLAEEE